MSDNFLAAQRIVIFRNGSIGNTLVALPLIKSLKHRLHSHITVIVDSVGYELLANTPYIDHLIVYEKRGKDRGLFNHMKLINKLRHNTYDVAILLKRFFRNELLAYLAGIKERIGFQSLHVKPFKLTRVMPYSEEENIIDLNLRLLTFFNIQPEDDRLEIFPSDYEKKIAQDFLHTHKLFEKDYFIAHFGGNTLKETKWPAEKYALLCEKILHATHKSVILICGPDEIEFNRQIVHCVNPHQRASLTLANTLPLKSSACLIEKSLLFFGNDSGPSHLADAVGKKSLIFFSHKENIRRQIEKWKPKGAQFIPLYSEDGNINNVRVDRAFEKFNFLLNNF
ncbi:MAG: glycosyltransferase family 9 protein [bacterium]